MFRRLNARVSHGHVGLPTLGRPTRAINGGRTLILLAPDRFRSGQLIAHAESTAYLQPLKALRKPCVTKRNASDVPVLK